MLHKAANAGDFRHALHAGEFIADLPILQRAELREIITAVRSLRRIDVKIILIDPAEPGGVRTELRCDALRHLALEKVQALQDT